MFAQLLKSRFAQLRPRETTQLPRGLAVEPLPLGFQHRLLAGPSLSGTLSWLSPSHPRKRQHKMTQAQPVPLEQWFQSSHPPSSQQDHRDSYAVLTPSQQIVMDPFCGEPCWMEPKRKPPLLAGTSTADVGSRQVVDSCRKHVPSVQGVRAAWWRRGPPVAAAHQLSLLHQPGICFQWPP